MAARRVFVSISPRSRYWSQVCESAEAVLYIALALIKENKLLPDSVDTQDAKLLVEERWGLRTHIVFDICHDDYNSETAHLSSSDRLPVIAVWLSAKESAQIATKGIKIKVNEETREFHRLHPIGVQPPFIVDHTNGKVPCFANPRA